MAVDEDEIDVLLAASDDGESDWVLDSGSAYHLCRDREVFSTYAACEGRIYRWRTTRLAELLAEGRSSSAWQTGGLTLVEEFSEFPRETRRCCRERRLEGYTDWRGVSRQEELLSDMGPMVLARRVDKGSNRCTEVCKASAGVPGGSGVDVHREAQRKETKSILRSYTAKGAATPKRVSFALDLISGGVLSSCAHKGGEMEPRQLAKCIHFGGKWSSPLMRLGISDAVLQSYGGAGSEAVRKDNLKTSDYPPVGWRGRLLIPAHLDESKPTWMSPRPVAKPKPD
ncbi:hypothetical protein Acr_20g0011560 [Actinidia rufa]|uniref:Uncharacterized protein n=1 Tax=Actinidia rufa TaxID=165716 RepID=A0A7J0GF59_9ERIC|nr:hypothetical protein Acr_20g0011560 [Actinidia rufa]